LFLQENFFYEADFLKLFDKNRMSCKLRFYSNAYKSFSNYFTPCFLKSYNISFSEEFITVFSQHIEQMFEDVFHIYKKYFHEIDAMDFDNFFKPNTNKYLNKEVLEEKNCILPYKIRATYNKTTNKSNLNENAMKKIQMKSNFKSDLDESSLDNFSNENKKTYKIRVNNVESLNKSNVTTNNLIPKSKNSENFFETERNTSNETQNKSIETNGKNNWNFKNSSFYSYPQSREQTNKKLNTVDIHSWNNFDSLGNKKIKNDDNDFVMKNVQKIQKLYSKKFDIQKKSENDGYVIIRTDEAFIYQNEPKNRNYEEKKDANNEIMHFQVKNLV